MPYGACWNVNQLGSFTKTSFEYVDFSGFDEFYFGCRVRDEGRCVEACAKGKHQSGGQCHLCDHTCATCVDAGPANCTSCDTGKEQTGQSRCG